MTSPNLTVLCHYRYDPLDQLISHALPDIPEHQRFYCKSRLATEIQGADQYSMVQHGDQLLAQKQRQSKVAKTALLTTDQQRSVLQMLNETNQQQPIAYSPYGHRRAENGLISWLGFNGERPDPVTGHYLLGNGYRAFNPALMRFNSPDSWSPFGKGGLNSYTYCQGDPINRSDSDGHISVYIALEYAAWRATKRVSATRQFNTLMQLSSDNSLLPSSLNALKNLETAKSSSISLKKAALSKVESFGIEPDISQTHAFKHVKASVAELNTNLDTARRQHAVQYVKHEFVRLGRLGRGGRAELDPSDTERLSRPLSPTSTKLVFDQLDKILDSANNSLRQS